MSKKDQATIKKSNIVCSCGGQTDWVYQEPVSGYRCPDCQNVLRSDDVKAGK